MPEPKKTDDRERVAVMGLVRCSVFRSERRANFRYGATHDYSYNITENPVRVHDLHATMLHLPGIGHERLTWKFQGRRFRLTDVHGEIVTPILA